MPKTVDRYAEHAKRFGVELVFETAAGFGDSQSDLTAMELIALARRLKSIHPKFDPAKPDKLVELTGADIRDAYLDRIMPVFDALGTPLPTSASRRCEWCGKAIAGRADRRTCSGAHREALRRSGGIGPFSRPDVTLTDGSDPSIASGADVTPTARRHRRNGAENGRVGDFREVASAPAEQLGLFEVVDD